MSAPEEFTTEGSVDKQGYRLVMRGELDIASEGMAETALIAAEVQAGERMLILDLRQLEFCGTVGLHLLTSARHRADKAGRPLLVLPSAAVRRLFEIARVTDDFDLDDASGADH